MIKVIFSLLSVTLLLSACAGGLVAKPMPEVSSGDLPAQPIAVATTSTTSVPAPKKPGTTAVYFVGNSLTFYNDLHQMFADLAEAGGHSVEVDMSSSGGGTLEGHAKSWSTRYKLSQRLWDYVVLQEQSEYPAIEAQRWERVYPALGVLKERIGENGASPVLFMTWGRRDGFPEAGYGTYEEMQAAVAAGYLEIAAKFQWMVAPVGIAWQSATAQRPWLELWLSDGIHPKPEGSYLAACVFYAAFFKQSPVGLGFQAGLPEDTARFLQGVAAATVLDNLAAWNIPPD